MDLRDFTREELNYIDALQIQADDIVSDPESQFYEPDKHKRFTAERQLMRKMEEEKAQRAQKGI